jgi:hypothetical protein
MIMFGVNMKERQKESNLKNLLKEKVPNLISLLIKDMFKKLKTK